MLENNCFEKVDLRKISFHLIRGGMGFCWHYLGRHVKNSCKNSCCNHNHGVINLAPSLFWTLMDGRK